MQIQLVSYEFNYNCIYLLLALFVHLKKNFFMRIIFAVMKLWILGFHDKVKVTQEGLQGV